MWIDEDHGMCFLSPVAGKMLSKSLSANNRTFICGILIHTVVPSADVNAGESLRRCRRPLYLSHSLSLSLTLLLFTCLSIAVLYAVILGYTDGVKTLKMS